MPPSNAPPTSTSAMLVRPPSCRTELKAAATATPMTAPTPGPSERFGVVNGAEGSLAGGAAASAASGAPVRLNPQDGHLPFAIGNTCIPHFEHTVMDMARGYHEFTQVRELPAYLAGYCDRERGRIRHLPPVNSGGLAKSRC